MTYPQGINFRATLGYVTDGANDSFENSNNSVSTGSYPRTTAQGNTVGWETFNGGSTRDRSTTVDARLAGINYTASQQNDFRFDLPAAGSYNIRIAAGDMSSVNATLWSLLDGTTSLGTLTTGTNVTSGSFKDATDTVRTAAAWPGSNVAVAKTFATTICRFRSSAAGATNLIAHAYVESAAPATPTGTLASTLGNATLAASGAVLNAGAFASTLSNATMAASGAVGAAPSGALASTLADATMSAAGAVTNAGSFAAIMSDATMAAAGIVVNRGALAATLSDATMSAAGTVAPNVTGTFSSTLDGATMTAYGYNGVPPVLAGLFQRLPKNPRHVQRIP